MIVIEPVNLPQRVRFPHKIDLPVVVPRPRDVPALVAPERKSALWGFGLLTALVAGVLWPGSGSPGKLGGAAPARKKSPGNKLLYMWVPPGKWFDEAVSIPKSQLSKYHQIAIATKSDRKPGRLFYIWSESAGYARWQLTQDATTRHKWTPTWEQTKRPPAGKPKDQLTLFGSELEGCRDKQGNFIPIPQCINRPSALLKEDTPKTKAEITKAASKVAKAVKGWQPVMGQTYDFDLEQGTIEILATAPKTTYYLIPKSKRRTLIESIPPEISKGYLMITPRGNVVSYDSHARPRMEKSASEVLEPATRKLIKQGKLKVEKKTPRATGKAAEKKLKEFWFFIPKKANKADYVSPEKLAKNRDFYHTAEMKKKGRLYKAHGFDMPDAKLQFMIQMEEARNYRRKYGGTRNPHELPYYAYTRDKGYRIVRLSQEQYDFEQGLSGQLSGDVENCAIWLPDNQGGYKCGGYARVCKPPACELPLDTTTKQIKVCTKTQRVYSPFYNREIERCKKYKAACEGSACMTEPMPYPGTPSERIAPSGSEVESLARWMADEYNQETFEKEPYLAREIMSRGGIRSYRKGMEKAEYKAIPLFMKDSKGLPPDEMAAEMDFDTDRDLFEAIAKAYPPKAKGAWKKLQRKTWEDFENAAFEMVEQGMEAGTWQGLSAESERITAALMAWLDTIPTTKRKPQGSSKKRGERAEIYDACLVIFGANCDSPGDKNYEKVKEVIASWGYGDMTQVFYDYKWRPGTLLENLRSGGSKWSLPRPKPLPEQLQLLGQDLFPDLRRELTLEPPEDTATSDDPVTACMERRGWRIPRIEQLKASISEKLTPDLFTQKTQKLTAGEKEYQRIVGECLEARSGTAGLFLRGKCRDKSGKFVPVPQCTGRRLPKKKTPEDMAAEETESETPKLGTRDTLRELDGKTIEIPEGHVLLKAWEKGGEFRLYAKLESPKYNKVKEVGYITDNAWDEIEYKRGLAYSTKISDIPGSYKIMEKVIDKILRKNAA